MKKHVVKLSSSAFCAAALWTSISIGYGSAQCSNGNIYQGIHSAFAFETDECFNTSTSPEFADITWAIARWNGLYGMLDRFSHSTGTVTCTIDDEEDGQNDILVTSSSYWLLDGLPGNSRQYYFECPSGEVYEADVAVSSALSTGVNDELFAGQDVRYALLHEFGHVLGMTHAPNGLYLTVMCSHGVCGRVGGGDQFGAGGDRTSSLLPDDVKFGLEWHGSASAGEVDLAISPYVVAWPQPPALAYGAGGQQIQACPGTTVNVKFSVVNLGKLSASTEIVVVLSTNSTISTYDPEWSSVLETVAGGTGEYISLNLVIPATLNPDQVYHVGAIVDPDREVSEDYEKNNSSKTGLRIVVPSGC